MWREVRWAVVTIGVFLGAHSAFGGASAPPLEAQLDMASDVVIGQITQITPVDENRGPGSHCGRATVEVKETLKGGAAKTLQFLVATSLDAGWHASFGMALHAVGDSGIWVISSGWVLDSGIIPADHQAEIVKILQELKDRKWSPAGNGLRAWAAVVPGGLSKPVIIFAVTNVSDADIYVPTELEPDFVKAMVTDLHDGKTKEFDLRTGPPMRTLYCRILSPGHVMYLHPDYSNIDLAWHQKLAPGKYSVVVSCINDRADGDDAGARAGETRPVTAWMGDLHAPAVELKIEEQGNQ